MQPMELSDPPIPVRRAAAPAGVLAETSFADIDEQAAALDGWNQRYLQLSAGAFCGRVQRLELDGIGLFVEDLQQAVHQVGQVRPQVVALGVPVLLEGHSRFCGAPGDAAALHVFSGRDGFEFRSPRRHVMLGIEVDAALLAAHGIEVATLTRHAHLHRGPGPALDALRRCLLELFAAAGARADAQQAPSSTPAHQAQCRQMRDDLIDRLAALLPDPGPDQPPTRSHGAGVGQAALCDHAHQLVATRLDDPPTVAELCQSLGVSRRTLPSAFQACWGMAPLAWLTTLRLDAVRRRLKTAGSVTEAATQLGFWHFGHFAHDYRELFGELPSQTLRRRGERASGARH